MNKTAASRFGSCRLLIFCVVITIFKGCVVGPNYKGPPEMDVGADWIQDAPVLDSSDQAGETNELARWWEALGDPILSRLIEVGLARNMELRQALLRIEEARALRDVALGRRVPSVGARGTVSARRQSENGPLPIDRIPGLDRDQIVHEVGVDLSWELDLFGRLHRTFEAVSARLEASVEDARAVQISIAAEIAAAYLDLRGAQRERTAIKANIAALARALELTDQRIRVGDLPPIERDRVRAQIALARTALPGLDARIQASAMALGTLLGGLPEDELALTTTPEHTGTSRPDEKDFSLPRIPHGQRADLLRRRPDIRSAERRLAASTADMGVAMAEIFPKLTIGASGGFQALDLGDLASAGSQVFSITPLLQWRIFEGGRIKAEIRVTEVRREQAALAYEARVLNALGEAERTLSNYRYARIAVSEQQAALAGWQTVSDTQEIRYKAGDISLLELLDAQRQVDQAKAGLAQAETLAAQQLITAFKALGGGWTLPAQAHLNH